MQRVTLKSRPLTHDALSRMRGLPGTDKPMEIADSSDATKVEKGMKPGASRHLVQYAREFLEQEGAVTYYAKMTMDKATSPFASFDSVAPVLPEAPAPPIIPEETIGSLTADQVSPANLVHIVMMGPEFYHEGRCRTLGFSSNFILSNPDEADIVLDVCRQRLVALDPEGDAECLKELKDSSRRGSYPIWKASLPSRHVDMLRTVGLNPMRVLAFAYSGIDKINIVDGPLAGATIATSTGGFHDSVLPGWIEIDETLTIHADRVVLSGARSTLNEEVLAGRPIEEIADIPGGIAAGRTVLSAHRDAEGRIILVTDEEPAATPIESLAPRKKKG